MKKTDLERHKGARIAGQLRQSGTPDRFGTGAAAVVDRRERRRLDQARGLVPFAVKLDAELAGRLRARAQADGTSLDELTAALLDKALAG